jgi:hypothetical protein
MDVQGVTLSTTYSLQSVSLSTTTSSMDMQGVSCATTNSMGARFIPFTEVETHSDRNI